ncbi:MAG: TetR/AcrR family transcriptional regulator [Streptosporangiaceae bacterium]
MTEEHAASGIAATARGGLARSGPARGLARGPARRPRRDSEANRERLLAAAAAVMLRDGRHVPLAAIAAEAGVGVGTLYRNYADRDALLQALEYRAYGLLIQILDDVSRRDRPGLESVREFLARTLDIAGQLILPLHGAPPLMTAEAQAARREISTRLDAFLDRGRADGTITAAFNATDVIVFSALITQPLAHGPDWPRLASRQIAIFAAGLASGGPGGIPGPPVTTQDIETAFGRARG